MSPAVETLAMEYITAGKMLRMLVADLHPNEYLHRIVPSANCAAWILGHLVLSERSFMLRIGIQELPELPPGFEKHFARDDIAPQGTDFGDVSILLPLFEQHRELMVNAVRQLPVEKLAEKLSKPHPLYGATLGGLLAFGPLHTVMHAGQISMIRRSLGRPAIV